MCNLTMEKICIVLFVCFVFVNTEVTIKSRGYSVLVSFSQNVKDRDGMMLLQNMKDSLKDVSDILYDAIGRQIIKVTFKIPDSWNTSKWNLTIDKPSISGSDKADFLIDNTNNVVFGKFPFAQQYGSCGTPGHQIIIPTDFFTDSNSFPKGTVLAREWLKYRYGVFDENGFRGDPLYPMYYNIPGNDPDEVRITDCTNSPVIYNFTHRAGGICSDKIIESLNSAKCSIKPEKWSVENVTSSLMYFQQDISLMRHICGKDPAHVHNAESPNKHNAMCRGKSVWDVVKISEDFQNKTDPEYVSDIEYVYEKGTKPKVIVVWENTAKVNKTKGAVILRAIKRIIYDLPSGSKCNGFPFSDTLSRAKDYTLRELNSLSEKNSIMTTIKSDFVRDVNGNINVALSKALDVLSGDPSDPELDGTVIVITKSSGTLDETLRERLQNSKVCVMFLYLTEDTVPGEIKEYVSALPCGSLEDIPLAGNDKNMFSKLFSAMETILPETVDDKITETAETGYLSKESPISLEVSATVETVTFWIFTDKESENFELKFNMMDEKLKQMETTDVMALTFFPKESGSIEFTYPHITDPIFTQVRVTSKAGKYFKGYILTRDTSEESSPDQMPVIIYAIILYGAYPLQNAKVLATVERPNGEEIQFEMFDDGRGDPDITKNDGIYSRYFTKFTEKGEYTVTVTVETGDSASYGIVGKAEYQTCCGSFVKLLTSKVPASSRKFKTTFTAKNGRPNDGYKPSRILDFRIAEVTDDKIVLKWSAPGEEGDSGTASQYEIKLFCKEENATDCDINKMIRVLNLSSPLNYSCEEEVTIQILIKTHILSIGIISFNEKKKMSDLSNLVQINGQSETTSEVITTNPETSNVQRAFIGTIVGSTIACILFIICIIVASIYYFKRKPRYREPKVRENEQNINTHDQEKIAFKEINTSMRTAPMKRNESFPVLLYTHDQVKDFKDKKKDPPLYKANILPKPWASLEAMSSLRIGDYKKDAISSSTVDVTDELETTEIK